MKPSVARVTRGVCYLALVLGGCGGGADRPAGLQDSGGDRAADSATGTGGSGAADGGAPDLPRFDAPAAEAPDAPRAGDAGDATDAPDARGAGDATDAGGAPSLAGVRLSPDAIDFGSQKQGVAGPATTVTITNGTSGAVTIGAVSTGGANAGDFTTTDDLCTGRAVASQASCTLGVVFTPQALGARSATLAIASTDAGLSLAVTVGGTGVATAPAVAVNPARVSFGLVVVGSAAPVARITVTNNGTAPLSISAVALAGDRPGDFTLGDDACTGTSVAGGGSCAVSVAFSPHAACKTSKATLTFTDGDATSPQTVNLSGAGVAGATGQFGSILYCTSPAAQPEKLAALTTGDVGFTEHGSRFSPPAVAAVNTVDGVRENPAAVQQLGWAPLELNVAPDGTTAYFEENFSTGNGILLDVVSPGGSKSQLPLFAGVTGPLGLGPDGAFWVAADHMCEGPASPFVKKVMPGSPVVDLTVPAGWIQIKLGTLCAVTTNLITAGPDGNVWLGLQQTSQAASGFIRLTTAGVFVDFIRTTQGGPLAATLGADGKLYALIGSTTACRLATFDDQGVEATALSLAAGGGMSCAALASGADGRLWRPARQFNGTAFVDTLAAFDPKTGAVAFYPSPPAQYLVAGPDEGLWFNSGPSAVGRFDLGGGPARAFVQPKTIGFPSTSVGVAAPTRTVTVRSTGTGPLTIWRTALGGPGEGEFVVADLCSGQVLAPGATCAVTVTSKPAHAGSTTATLTIESDDAFGPQTVSLAKFTVPPPPQISRAQISFPATRIGKKSSPISLTLTNPADSPVAVSSVGTRGTDNGDFQIVADLCSGTTVAAKGTCDVWVVFAPTGTAGARVANVLFIDAATPPTQTVALSGTAQAAASTGGGTDGGGGDGGGGAVCSCSSGGSFVDPVVVAPSATVDSPHGLFTLAEVSGDAHHPVASITVSTHAGAPVLMFVPPIDSTWPVTSPWGFSPDDNRFVVHYQTLGLDWIQLFDLAGTNPSMPVWTRSLPIAPGSTVTSPSGSVAFSPHGDYLLATQLQTPAGSLLQTLFLYIVGATGSPAQTLSWNSYRVPQGDGPDTTVDSAFWGFGPDDGSLTYIALDATGVATLSLLALPTGTVVQTHAFTGSLAAYVQYAPCGEVLALVDQITDPLSVSFPTPVTVSLYGTRAADRLKPALGAVPGLPAADAGISIVAGPTSYTAQSADFPNTLVLAPNNATGTCRN